MEIKSSVVLLDGSTIAFCTLQWHHRVSDWNLKSSICYIVYRAARTRDSTIYGASGSVLTHYCLFYSVRMYCVSVHLWSILVSICIVSNSDGTAWLPNLSLVQSSTLEFICISKKEKTISSLNLLHFWYVIVILVICIDKWKKILDSVWCVCLSYMFFTSLFILSTRFFQQNYFFFAIPNK